MRNSKFSESQIIKAHKTNQQCRSEGNISRELGIDNITFYFWRKKYGISLFILNFFNSKISDLGLIYHFG